VRIEPRVALDLSRRISIRELQSKLSPSSRTKSMKTLSQQLISVAWTMTSVIIADGAMLMEEYEPFSSSEEDIR